MKHNIIMTVQAGTSLGSVFLLQDTLYISNHEVSPTDHMSVKGWQLHAFSP